MTQKGAVSAHASPMMRFAYADPPYIGRAYLYAEKTEVDHAALITRLVSDFPDGWALSCHSPSLRVLLPLTPPKTRVMAWVKPWVSFKPGVNPAFAWEPLLVFGGRRARPRDRRTVRDWLSSNATTRKGMPGAKPRAFAAWLFDVLGAELGDELVDLYPGSGAIVAAWLEWQQSRAAG